MKYIIIVCRGTHCSLDVKKCAIIVKLSSASCYFRCEYALYPASIRQHKLGVTVSSDSQRVFMGSQLCYCSRITASLPLLWQSCYAILVIDKMTNSQSGPTEFNTMTSQAYKQKAIIGQAQAQAYLKSQTSDKKLIEFQTIGTLPIQLNTETNSLNLWVVYGFSICFNNTWLLSVDYGGPYYPVETPLPPVASPTGYPLDKSTLAPCKMDAEQRLKRKGSTVE